MLLLVNNKRKKLLAKGILLTLALTSSLSALTIEKSSIKASFINSPVETRGVASSSDIDESGMSIEYKVKTKELDPFIYVGVNSFSDRDSINLRVGIEQQYSKIEDVTPFTSISIGGIYSKWSKEPISSATNKDDSASGYILNVEGGVYFQENIFISASASVMDLDTELNVLGSSGAISEDSLLAVSIGYGF